MTGKRSPKKITVAKMIINTYEFHARQKMVMQVSGKTFKDNTPKKKKQCLTVLLGIQDCSSGRKIEIVTGLVRMTQC